MSKIAHQKASKAIDGLRSIMNMQSPIVYMLGFKKFNDNQLDTNLRYSSILTGKLSFSGDYY